MNLKFFKNKKVLITGASGFKGAWLSLILHMLNAKVYGLGFKPNMNEKLFNQIGLKKKIIFKYIDVTNKKELKKYIDRVKPSIIFHLAAQPILSESYKYPFETLLTNSIGTLNLLDICKKIKYIKSIVCITSDKCYKNSHSTRGFKEQDKLGGEDPYSASKACAEIIAESYYKSFFKKKGVGLATTRAGNVIGGGDWSPNRLVPDCINWLINNQTIKIRRPNFNRPWQHVLDPLYGYIQLSYQLYKKPEKFSGSWNFGSKKGNIISVKNIVIKIIKNWGSGSYKVLNKKLFYEQENLQLNIQKSANILKWHPKFSIKESIALTVEWYKFVHLNGSKSAEFITKKQISSYLKKISI